MQSNLPEHAAGEILDVSIIIPMRNEQKYIARCLDSLLANGFPEQQYEILVADGESEDGSRDVVLAKAAAHPSIRLLHNSGRFVPSGMNLAIRQARGRYIIRVDAHCEYPPDYIQNCIAELKRTGAGNVGGRCLTRPGSGTQMAKAIALFTQTRVGVGNAAYRLGEGDRYVDTVPFGAFPREVFDRVGLYREDLFRNQDFELNARIRRAGYRIYLSSKISSVYYNSGTFRKFMRQAWMNGIWAPRMWFRYPGQLLLAPRRPARLHRRSALQPAPRPVMASRAVGRTHRTCRVPGRRAGHRGFNRSTEWLEARALGRADHALLPLPVWSGYIDGPGPKRRHQSAGSPVECEGQGTTMKRLFDFTAASLALVLLSPAALDHRPVCKGHIARPGFLLRQEGWTAGQDFQDVQVPHHGRGCRSARRIVYL